MYSTGADDVFNLQNKARDGRGVQRMGMVSTHRSEDLVERRNHNPTDAFGAFVVLGDELFHGLGDFVQCLLSTGAAIVAS